MVPIPLWLKWPMSSCELRRPLLKKKNQRTTQEIIREKHVEVVLKVLTMFDKRRLSWCFFPLISNKEGNVTVQKSICSRHLGMFQVLHSRLFASACIKYAHSKLF